MLTPTKLQLKVRQPEEGYRFSVDSLLLADFVRLKKRSKIVEFGAGCGIICLILAKRFPECTFYAVEVQEELYRFLEENIEKNRIHNITPLLADIRDLPSLFPAGSFHHVVSNPPFRRPDTGRLCPLSQEALARHEILIDMDQIIDSARLLLKTGGRFSVIYPSERTAELITAMKRVRLEPKRLCFVHPGPERQARLVMAEGIKDAKAEVRILPPIFINQ